ncbi:hypothetical protein E3H11_19175 [Bradyrhizobium brasilense]|nr:hypothetical protein [Bradyrhizobium brasilense]
MLRRALPAIDRERCINAILGTHSGHANFLRMSALDKLPPAQRDAAHAALRQVIGTAAIEAVTSVSGGATSAQLFRIDAGGENYLLRIEGMPSPLRNPFQYVSLRIAAEAGIAPRLHYVDEASRVAVMDFVQRQPLGRYPGGLPALAKALGELLARLQATPTFPAFVRYPDIVARLWAHVGRTGLFAPGVLERCNAHLARIRAAYAWDEVNSVSSHNDSLPANILFDGNRLWMIDWESAYRTDPLVDLAIVGDSLARTPELESILHRAWLGRPLDEPLRARLAHVRALTRLYYAGVLLSASATAPRTIPDTSLAAPTLAELAEATRAGRLKAGTPAAKHVLGKMFVASFLTEVATPGFDLSV